jgi:hypothetical protein
MWLLHRFVVNRVLIGVSVLLEVTGGGGGAGASTGVIEPGKSHSVRPCWRTGPNRSVSRVRFKGHRIWPMRNSG